VTELYHGREVSILFSEEEAIGTPITPARDLMFNASASASDTKNIQKKHGMGTGAPKLAEGKYGVSGSISGSLQHAEILEYILGAPTDTGSSDPYTHAITSIAESTKSITLQYGEDGTADINNTYDGVFINNVEITASEDDVAQIKIDWVGLNVTNSDSTVAAVVDTHQLYSMRECSLSIGGVLSHIETATFKFSRGADPSNGIGNLVPQAIKQGNWDIEVSFTAKLTDSLEYLKAIGGSTPAAQTANTVILTFDNGTSGEGEREVVLTVTGMLYNTFDTDLGTDKYATFSGTLFGTGGTYSAKDATANWNV